MNSFIGIGNLTRDVDLKYTDSGLAIGRFTLALNRMKKEGQEQKADFINIVTFGKTAENCSNYLSKGKKVGVEGRLQSGKYTNKDNVVVYTVDVVANQVEFLEWADKGNKKEESFDAPDGFNDVSQNGNPIPF